MSTPQEIIAILQLHRFPLTSEKQCQAAIAKALEDAGTAFDREYRLGEDDIPDFRIGSAFIEVKVGGSKSAIFRQCKRYCRYEEVTDLILASNIAIGLPATVNGKSLWLLQLGRGWL